VYDVINTCLCVFTCAAKPVIGELHSVLESRGMTATLLCRSYGHPAPTVTFRRLEPATGATYRSGRIYVSQLYTVSSGFPAHYDVTTT